MKRPENCPWPRKVALQHNQTALATRSCIPTSLQLLPMLAPATRSSTSISFQLHQTFRALETHFVLKKNIWAPAIIPKFTMHNTTTALRQKVTLQLHQIVRLPRITFLYCTILLNYYMSCRQNSMAAKWDMILSFGLRAPFGFPCFAMSV